jgi:CDP-glucose 4,6-dehydratase
VLQHLGADVYGCSPEPNNKTGIFYETDLHDLITSHTGDLRNFDYLNNLISRIDPEIIIHISPTSGYYQHVEPKEVYSTNLLGTLNLLEVCKQNPGVKLVINLVPDFSSAPGFTDGSSKNPGEIELIRGSFQSTEFLTSGYRNAYFKKEYGHEHNKNIFNLKTCQVIGGGDWSKQNPLKNLQQTINKKSRYFEVNDSYEIHVVHVLDVIYGLMKLIQENLNNPSAFTSDCSLMPGDDFKVRESTLAGIFGRYWSKDICFELSYQSNTQYESPIRVLQLSYPPYADWKPVINLERAVQMTIEWDKARDRGANMQIFTLNQIRDFLNGLHG